MLPITGYVDRLSGRPGDSLAFKVDCRVADRYSARLIRVRHGDPNPDGPGIREIDLGEVFSGTFAGRQQDCHLGSYARVLGVTALTRLRSFTLTAVIWPTTPEKNGQGVIAVVGSDKSGISLALDGAKGVRATIESAATGVAASVATGTPLRERRWYRIWARYDADSGTLTAGHRALEPHAADGDCEVSADASPLGLPAHVDIYLGAAGGDPVIGHFNGKLERPRIIDGSVEANALASELPKTVQTVAEWDFSIDIPGLRAIDTGPHRLHANLVNMPARAMTGSNWTGDEPNWRHAPAQYGAIHFHDDDIHDCGWETGFSFTIPDDLRSGVYGMRLEAGGVSDMIPFFVLPKRGTRTSDVCVLIPTFTYVIYGNHARGNTTDAYRERAKAWNARPWTPDEHREYGLSTYNFHSDGSGICHASALRPMISFRSAFLSIPELPGSGLRHFPADTHLLDWLEEKGIAFDVVTDHDLHEDGLKAITPYSVLMTTTHPEYHTDQTFDALESYTHHGGRLMYLGGNGFYWRIAVHRDIAGVLEIRRGEVGMRAWAAEPGEFFNAFDGHYGGLWRRVGRPPNRISGIGFSSQGKFEAGYYRRKPGSRDPRAAWIFDGIEDEIIGNFGLSGQGAAGYELDRADPKLGTPEDAVILATSEGLPASYVAVPEDLLSHVSTWNGEPVKDLIRSDMVYLERSGGGAVFSVGSITFCGSLSHNNYDNNVSRIVENVLKRFRQ